MHISLYRLLRIHVCFTGLLFHRYIDYLTVQYYSICIIRKL